MFEEHAWKLLGRLKHFFAISVLLSTFVFEDCSFLPAFGHSTDYPPTWADPIIRDCLFEAAHILLNDNTEATEVTLNHNTIDLLDVDILFDRASHLTLDEFLNKETTGRPTIPYAQLMSREQASLIIIALKQRTCW